MKPDFEKTFDESMIAARACLSVAGEAMRGLMREREKDKPAEYDPEVGDVVRGVANISSETVLEIRKVVLIGKRDEKGWLIRTDKDNCLRFSCSFVLVSRGEPKIGDTVEFPESCRSFGDRLIEAGARGKIFNARPISNCHSVRLDCGTIVDINREQFRIIRAAETPAEKPKASKEKMLTACDAMTFALDGQIYKSCLVDLDKLRAEINKLPEDERAT